MHDYERARQEQLRLDRRKLVTWIGTFIVFAAIVIILFGTLQHPG